MYLTNYVDYKYALEADPETASQKWTLILSVWLLEFVFDDTTQKFRVEITLITKFRLYWVVKRTLENFVIIEVKNTGEV